jgi:UPF0716 protein FxsA
LEPPLHGVQWDRRARDGGGIQLTASWNRNRRPAQPGDERNPPACGRCPSATRPRIPNHRIVLLRLLLVVLVTAVAELALLFYLADWLGWLSALLLVLITGAVGIVLLRMQNWQASRRIRRDLKQGHLPTEALFDTVLLLLAGVLLIVPGPLTDALGVLLVIPRTRRVVKRRIVERIRSRFALGTFTAAWDDESPHDRIIDVQIRDERDNPRPDR